VVDPQKPRSIEGIKVDHFTSKLHFLHGTCFVSYGKEGDQLFVADGSTIGEYEIHYEDKTMETIPLVYGKHVRDWWNWDKPIDVSDSKVAWSGENAYSRKMKKHIHVYLTSWENPHPNLKITSIDYVSTGGTAAAPFCISITAEEGLTR